MRKDDGEVIEISGFLGNTTNNVAEYAGLLEALATAKSEGATDVEIVSDSLLLVQQMLPLLRRLAEIPKQDERPGEVAVAAAFRRALPAIRG